MSENELDWKKIAVSIPVNDAKLIAEFKAELEANDGNQAEASRIVLRRRIAWLFERLGEVVAGAPIEDPLRTDENGEEEGENRGTMNITPLNGRIIIEPIAEDNVTEGGLFIPAQAKEAPCVGTVKAASDGWHTETGAFIASKLKIGDKVIFGKYAGSTINIDRQEMLLLQESDVFGIVG